MTSLCRHLTVVSTGNCKLGHDCRRVCSHRRHDATRLRCWQIWSDSSRLSPSCEFRAHHWRDEHCSCSSYCSLNMRGPRVNVRCCNTAYSAPPHHPRPDNVLLHKPIKWTCECLNTPQRGHAHRPENGLLLSDFSGLWVTPFWLFGSAIARARYSEGP